MIPLKNVLIKVLKDSKFVASRADLGSLFHRTGAATWKALSVTDWVKIRPQNSSIMVQFNTASPQSHTKNCQYE